MSTPASTPPPGAGAGQPTEEEMRVAYEAELKGIRVEDVLVQTVISLLNLGARKAGLAGGPEADDEHDPEQVRQAIEASRALLPLVEPVLGPEAKQVRDAISQLQIAYARSRPGGEAAGGEPPAAAPETPGPGDGGPAQSSGRLWVPGQ